MYYITEKSSVTGRKFQALRRKLNAALQAQKVFARKYGFHEWRGATWCCGGGLSSCGKFDTVPDPKIWGKGTEQGEYYPKASSLAGKAILEEMKQLPRVKFTDVNACIGFDGGIGDQIGFNATNKRFIGIILREEWVIKMPEDCTEVTRTRYLELFPEQQ
jgi:hypothetical protein